MSHKTVATMTHVGSDTPREIAMPLLLSRIMLKVKLTDNGCWEWTGGKTRLGYPETTLAGKSWRVHRFVYEALTNKPIPQGMDICHSCHNRACINPYHIRQDTHQANMMDSSAAKRLQGQKKTHCLRGHPLSGDNLMTGVFRGCKICSRGRYRRRLGWPEHLAFSEFVIPDGYKMDRTTGQVVPQGPNRGQSGVSP